MSTVTLQIIAEMRLTSEELAQWVKDAKAQGFTVTIDDINDLTNPLIPLEFNENGSVHCQVVHRTDIQVIT